MITNRYSRIVKTKEYKEAVAVIAKAEENRIFCRHDISHFMDVARIATILSLDMGMNLSRDLIYGAALTHDLGRARQYVDNIPHEKAGAEIAGIILKNCGYDAREVDIIQSAILNHRNDNSDISSSEENALSYILFKADKMSRNCFDCAARKECKWEKFNEDIII